MVVFNVHVPDTLDNEVLQRMYDRLETVATEMAGVAEEYKEGLKEDILGELVGNLDVQDVLDAAATQGIERSRVRMEEALQRAREAAERQEEILRHASGYDPNALRDELRLDDGHLIAFAEGMCEFTGVEVANKSFNGTVWDLRLPESLQRDLAVKQNHRIAFTREAAATASGAEMFAPEHFLYDRFLVIAKAYRRGGWVAAAELLGAACGFGAMLRWMDNEGRPTHREYVGIRVHDDGSMDLNSEDWADFLKRPLSGSAIQPPPSRSTWGLIWERLDQESKKRIDGDIQPDVPYPLGFVWRA